MVGAAGFELATPCTPCKCATRLRYAPTSRIGILHESFFIFKKLHLYLYHRVHRHFYCKKGTNISIDPFELARQSYFLFHKKGAMWVNDCCCDLGTFIPIVKVGLCPGNGGTAKRGLSICPTAAGFSRCTFD